jgi:large subunit ribosomal protein L19
MSRIIDQIDAETQQRAEPLRYREGDQVKVHVKIKEGSKERVQVFERIFPLYSPTVEKIEWLKRSRVRRSRLYFLRNLRGKKARLAEVRDAVEPGPYKRSEA